MEGTHTHTYMYIKAFGMQNALLISDLNSVQVTDDPDTGGAIAQTSLRAGFATNCPPGIIKYILSKP
jgi:hypothetical protein